MCNLTDNFMEDLIFDLEYQEYLYNKRQEKNQQWEEHFYVEQQAYEIMARQHFKDLEQYEKSQKLQTT